MPSTYTVNLGIEKPATGEQSGTWGDTVNDNSNILDEAINGAVTITLSSAGSSGSPNSITITNGASSTGRNKWIEFGDGGDLGAAAYVQLTPNDAEKICNIRNSLSGNRSIFIFQGNYSTSNDLEIAAGTDVVVKFNGGGTGATVVNVYANLKVDGIVATTADINGGTIDATVIGGSTAAAVTGTTVVANTSVNIAGDGATVTGIKDEDNMASNSATKLATQQSIKAYVDSQVGTVDTLAEILANGNTTGSTDIDVAAAQKVQFRDAAIYINSSVDGQLDIVADTEIQIAATTIDINGAIVASGDISAASLDISGNVDIDGVLNVDAIDIDGAVQLDATLTVGVDDTGYDVKFYGATGGAYMLWDQSADDLILAGAGGLVVAGNVDFNGDLDVDGTTNLDVVDIDGAVDMASTLAIADTTTIVKTASGVTKALKLYNNTAGANNRVAIDFHTASTLYGTIEGGYGASSPELNFIVSSVDSLKLSTSGAVFNESSADIDFRVESNDNTHMLFVEAGANRVGINNSDPSSTLHISGTYGDTGFIRMSGGAQEHYWYLADALNSVFNIGTGSAAAAFDFRTNNASKFKIGVSASTFSTNITLNQLTTFPTTGFINHTNGFLYAEGGTNGIILRSASGGAQMMKIQPGEVAVNDDSADIDFRVESANNANAFRVDAGADQVRTDAVFVHDADGANQPFYITRSGGLDQALKITMDDNNVMLTSAQDETSGANFIFYSTNATTSNLPLLQLDYSAGAVFNESGVNYQHVRMESDTDTHAFYLNAVNGFIGMGAGASPTQPLSVGARTGANLNYINGTTNSVSTDSGILISDTITSESDVGFGLLLANNANNDNARSPIIGFSALSASTSYNHMYAAINARKVSNGADTNWNMGQLEFSTGSGTGPHIRAVLDKNGGLITTPIATGHTVFNEDGIDADFRVESDANTHMLFVDAGQNKVKIGSSATPPVGFSQLQVGSMGIIGALGLSGTNPNDTGININQGGSGGTALIVASNNTGNAQNTDSAVYMVQFYYDGNHTPTKTKIAGDDFITIGKTGSSPNETMTLTNTAGGNGTATIFMCT